ncbi:uncharacterized protein LOC122662844 [Telopea speciosissima]|uniref:uncharacterized protein LOC122662844 n=1 Tax=Telopea speciosissima TaxID=54955 RepID=UPI001CC4EECA|nr:uncharacterized protein LOC122662844 [Telopea speciosissima]
MATGGSSSVAPPLGTSGGPAAGNIGLRSWSSLLQGGLTRDGLDGLPFIEPTVVNDKKVARCCAKDLSAERDRWESTLVGYVFGPRPSFTAMKRFTAEKWGHVGAVEVFGLESGIFIFDFQRIELSNQILDEGPWTFGNRPLIIRHWTLDILLTRKEEHQLPLWVRLYGLNLHFWGTQALGKIASVLGKPICVDRRTSQRERLSFACFWVLVKATDGLPSSIPIALDDGTIVEQHVMYDWAPPLCNACKVFGHTDSTCPKLSSSNALPADQAGMARPVEPHWQAPTRRRPREKRPLLADSVTANPPSPATGPSDKSGSPHGKPVTRSGGDRGGS